MDEQDAVERVNEAVVFYAQKDAGAIKVLYSSQIKGQEEIVRPCVYEFKRRKEGFNYCMTDPPQEDYKGISAKEGAIVKKKKQGNQLFLWSEQEKEWVALEGIDLQAAEELPGLMAYLQEKLDMEKYQFVEAKRVDGLLECNFRIRNEMLSQESRDFGDYRIEVDGSGITYYLDKKQIKKVSIWEECRFESSDEIIQQRLDLEIIVIQ